ncbi:hypothetical protein SOCE26_045060 [Sorangium cellulosum]|uniref:Uncharacterized protein n=1 Tax=Sorangium cellulosum TaxID=56 RepID=A0A2L0EUT9_SORCE|nr:hypothetical protein [Sorangium cellulosum]AUX43066.1 hypothetical protein SOCE26_045060 [Sorangium cellulosum]
MSKDHSRKNREDASTEAVGQRIAELAELVAAGCGMPVASSAVREEFEALVDEIRARASEGEIRAPQRSSTHLKGTRPGDEHAAASFEFHEGPPSAHVGRVGRGGPEKGAAPGSSRVVSLDDARRVLDAIRREESSGDGPREDLQRAIA